MRLIKIKKENIGATRVDMPFKLNPNERLTWSDIIEEEENKAHNVEFGVIHRDDWNKDKLSNEVIQNRIGEIDLNEELMKGSNDEKISVIIKAWNRIHFWLWRPAVLLT